MHTHPEVDRHMTSVQRHNPSGSGPRPSQLKVISEQRPTMETGHQILLCAAAADSSEFSRTVPTACSHLEQRGHDWWHCLHQRPIALRGRVLPMRSLSGCLVCPWAARFGMRVLSVLPGWRTLLSSWKRKDSGRIDTCSYRRGETGLREVWPDVEQILWPELRCSEHGGYGTDPPASAVLVVVWSS